MRKRISEGTTSGLAADGRPATVAELEERGRGVSSPPEEVPWGVSAVIAHCHENPFNPLGVR